MGQIKSLLIAEDQPSGGYGTGQRLLALKRALDALGECRFVRLTNEVASKQIPLVRYTAPSQLPAHPTRRYWIERQLTFAEFRPHGAAQARMEEIFREFPFDVAVCSFFRATVAAPLHLAPCLIDGDRLPEPEGTIGRALWPATRRVMNWRAGQFHKTFIIRAADAQVLDKVDTVLLPCISTAGGPPIPVEPGARNVLFIGGAGWGPNRDAMDYLVRTLPPRLAQIGTGGFVVRLVGPGTEAFAGVPGVSAGGFVDDIKAEYRRAALVACPVWTGGGANVKLAEAIQNGAAVVASAHAASGFAGVMVPGRDLVAAPDRTAFADAIVQLLQDEARLATLRKNAALLADDILSQARFDQIVARSVTEAVERWKRKSRNFPPPGSQDQSPCQHPSTSSSSSSTIAPRP